MFRFVEVSTLLLAAGVQAGFRYGGCPDMTMSQETFDVDRYVGQWHEIVRDKLTWFEAFSGCVIADYKLREDGSVRVHNKSHYEIYGWYDLVGSAVMSTKGDASL